MISGVFNISIHKQKYHMHNNLYFYSRVRYVQSIFRFRYKLYPMSLVYPNKDDRLQDMLNMLKTRSFSTEC